jgi:uncharacterized membrane protein
MHSHINKSVKMLTTAGVLAAAIVLLTTLVSIPMPGGLGYINLGDAGVLLAGALLGGGWGALCAGAASALSDILLGWGVYAPATLIIKGTAALIVGALFTRTEKHVRYLFFYLAALVVPAGYFFYETLLYGSAAAIPNIPFNAMQCIAGAGVAHAMTVLLQKTKFFSPENALLPVCAEILREPKNGPDLVLIAKRKMAPVIKKAGDLLSVQGYTARLVVIDDAYAFERLSAAKKERFLPPEKPFVRVEDAETTPEEVMHAALEAVKS